MTPDEIAQFKEWGQPLPTRDPHGTEEEIAQHLKPEPLTNWRQRGNELYADIGGSTMMHRLPTDVILTGTDKDGLPTFKKIVT